MILRRNNIRRRNPKMSKTFPNKVKLHRKKTPKKSTRLVELPKLTKAVDVLQNSLKRNVLCVRKQINIMNSQLTKVSLKGGKYRLRNSSCIFDDLLFMASTPNKSEKENKESRTSSSKDGSLAKRSSRSISNRKKSDKIFIKKVPKVLDRKKGLSISPIPVVHKVPDVREEKTSASVSPKRLTTRQTVPLSKKRTSQLLLQTDLLTRSSLETRNRSSLRSKSLLSEDSLKKKKSPYSKNCSEKPSKIKERKKELLTPIRNMRKSSTSIFTMPEGSNMNKSNITPSKSCSKKSFQENKGKKCHSITSKTKGNIKKSGDPPKRNKTELSRQCHVILKRISPTLKMPRDDLNNSSNNTTTKNVSFYKLRKSVRIFSAHQLGESNKTPGTKDNRLRRSCDENLNISTRKTSTKNSTIIFPTPSKRSTRNSFFEKANGSTQVNKNKNNGVGLKDSDFNYSKPYSRVQQKRRHTVPLVKKKNNVRKNTKNSNGPNKSSKTPDKSSKTPDKSSKIPDKSSKKPDKSLKSSRKWTSKLPSLPMFDKYFYDINNIPVDDLTTATFLTPSSYIKTQNKRTKRSEVTSTPLNKKALLKLEKNPGGLSYQEIARKGLPTKGTLKRKRFMINALKEKSEGYEDDIFESSKFAKFKETVFMDDDSDISGLSIVTPKCAFLVTPKMPEKTPRLKDCFSPMELMKARKVAEEYIHRRNKRKLQSISASESSLQERNANSMNDKSANEDPEKKKLDFISLAKCLNEKPDKTEDSDEDVYFSDASS